MTGKRGWGTAPGVRAPAGLIVLVLVALAAGLACSNYMRRSAEIRNALARSEFQSALESIDEIDTSNSELLQLYERGLVLHCQGEYTASNVAFERAEQVLEELYTRSVTRELATLTVSETLAQYRGDAFEAVLVNYYKILNYLSMGDYDGAMVECRRVNRKLQMLQDGGETYFENDAFLQYLTAMVYDTGGDTESAGVSYRTAAMLYSDSLATLPAPPSLWCDAADNARRSGDTAEAATLAGGRACPEPAGNGRVTVLLECGEVAVKSEATIVLPILKDDRWDDDEHFAHELAHRQNAYYHKSSVKYWLRVSLPVFTPMPPRAGHVVVRARRAGEREDVGESRAVVVEDIDGHALRAFNEKQSTVLVRAIVRALVKYAAQDAADDQDETLGALVNLLGVVTETADTRSWSTLPQSVWMARLDLPPGTYALEADVFAPDGTHAAEVTFSDVVVGRDGAVFTRARVF